MDIGTILPIGAFVISLIALILTRIDKAKKDGKEDNLVLLNYKVDELKKDFTEFVQKFEKYDYEIDERIDKAIELHIELYHKRRNKNDNR